MTPASPATGEFRNRLEVLFMRFAASGFVPARWFLREIPPPAARRARTGYLSVEIVSHCWRYAHLLAYQLSSLVLHPPTRLDVTMTVFHAADDQDTVRLLRQFGEFAVPRVTWNWRAIEPARLFRRAIGRNLAARATRCDWVWFTDCDVVFHAGCLDGLASALQGRRDALVYPREEWITPLLDATDPMLLAGRELRGPIDIPVGRFAPSRRGRATGPLQITHGDVARACGYCAQLPVYQRPSPRWAKAQEDVAFRWLLRTHGTPLDVPGVFRICHLGKGRYRDGGVITRLRKLVRRVQARVR